MSLPADNNILLSLVNTALRDGDDLSGFCAAYGVEEAEVISRLTDCGYAYDKDGNCFKRI